MPAGETSRFVVCGGPPYLKTYGDVLREALFKGFQRKRLTASGTEPAPNNMPVGLTIPRPVVVKDIRYCGKEIIVDESEAPADEGLTPEELNATVALEYKKPASHEAQRLLADGVDAARNAGIMTRVENVGVSRTTAWRIRNGRHPREKTARKLRRACEGEIPNNLVDDNDLRKLVRAVGIKEIARLAGISNRTVFYFMKGQRPHNSTLDKIRYAIVLAAWKNGWVAGARGVKAGV